MRTGQAAPRRSAPATAPTPPVASKKAPQSPEFESGRGKVADDQYLSAGEIVALGAALQDLVQTPGWRMLDTLLTRIQNKAAVQGIRDDAVSKDTIKGKLDVIDEIRTCVATYIAEAAAVADPPPSKPDTRVIAAMLGASHRRKMV